ncbi:MAG TPA: hypothetical protein VFR17_11285 [Mycobacterium sp.]|nr:hypothetical protein [Mycobacterium sp.]
MSTISGLPAHILLNHFVVVLAPLTAILLIVCALWPTARQRLVWLVLVLAAVTLAVTPLTVKAGEWLADHVGDTPPDLEIHENAGELATWFIAVPLLVAAILLAGLHVFAERGRALQPVLRWAVTVVVIALSAGTMYEIHHIGESGARAAWGGFESSAGSG